jgi:hypothetical protein
VNIHDELFLRECTLEKLRGSKGISRDLPIIYRLTHKGTGLRVSATMSLSQLKDFPLEGMIRALKYEVDHYTPEEHLIEPYTAEDLRDLLGMN